VPTNDVSGATTAEGTAGALSSNNTEARPYSGIKQRLLGYLVTNALKGGEKPGENESLKRFFFRFKEYHSLLMWKMQMLDGGHLLIKFDTSPFLGSSEAQSVHARYSGVFNIQSGKFICFFLNRNEELAYLYQNFTDFFRMASSSNHTWSRFVSSYSNSPFLRAQLDKQRDRYNKIYGSESELSKHISSFLPLSPQMTNSSPYLDSRLFQFDDRFVSPHNCPKPVAEHAVKFLTRGLHSATRFKIDPFPASDEEEERDSDNYVSYVFHPVYPFAISCICNPVLPTPKVMKFFFR
jgi:de-etiolated-1